MFNKSYIVYCVSNGVVLNSFDSVLECLFYIGTLCSLTGCRSSRLDYCPRCDYVSK